MVTLPELSPAVADASVRFFSTSGLSAAELLRNLRANAVAPCGLIDYGWFTGDARPLGCDKWYTSWSTSTSLEVCTLTSLATANTVWLPQWTSPQQVPEPLLDWWKRALEVIRSHEAGHVRISLQGTETLRTQLKQAACPQFQSVFDAWQAEINAAQEAYDREQYPLPLPPAPRP
jgi:predicted secreted Zn-dependent protease